jgi:hypothetical protein
MYNELGPCQVKVNLSLCFLYLTKHYTMKTCSGVDIYIHAFLTSALDEGEWLASSPGRFTRRERVPGTHWIRGWVGPGLDAAVKRRILHCSRQESNPGRQARSVVSILTELFPVKMTHYGEFQSRDPPAWLTAAEISA